MSTPIYQVDAFADGPFTGNPAAVCLCDEARDAGWMQSVAAEMNLSETAFVDRRDEGFGLRWFTPLVEVELCGHATLASAAVCWDAGWLPAGAEARFLTRSGWLGAVETDRGIELDFPRLDVETADAPAGLGAAIGAAPRFCGRTRDYLLVELASDGELRGLAPDFAALRALGVGGLIVTARAESAELDFVSRFFAPGFGIDEDPVTGSAHTSLGPYWAERLEKTELRAFQASARGGDLELEVGAERVKIRGGAQIVLRGELCV